MAKALSPKHLKACLLEALAESIDPEKSICVAYSGGLDSAVLLHLVASVWQGLASTSSDTVIDSLRRDLPNNKIHKFAAYHVNHGISKHANAWQAHCEAQANRYGIAFFSSQLQLRKQNQQSLEADAREARYAELSTFASNEYQVLLAQHQDDQAETFILQLKRGAGVKGLSCMPKQYTDNAGVSFVRPLLDFSRAKLLQYAKQEQLEWIEDESNQDQAFERNFVRHTIMPALSERWPQITKTISRSAQHCASTQQVVDEYMGLIAKQVLRTSNCAYIPALLGFESATQKAFLRFWLADLNQTAISTAQLDSLIGVLMSDNQTKRLYLDNLIVERSLDTLLLHRTSDAVGKPQRAENVHEHSFVWEDKQYKVSDVLSLAPALESEQGSFFMPLGECEVRYAQSKLRAKLQDNRPSKTLKRWYQEWKISALQRKQVAVITYREQVIALWLPSLNQSKVSVLASRASELTHAKQQAHCYEGTWAKFTTLDNPELDSPNLDSPNHD